MKKIILEVDHDWTPTHCDKCVFKECSSDMGGVLPNFCPLAKAKELVEVKATSGLGVLYDEMDCTDGFEVDGVRKTIWMEK